MKHSAVFLKLRVIAFSFTTCICFVWIILLSVLLFLRWDISSQSERSFLVLFLIVDTLTVIMLPILILAKFRTWLDGARLLLLLIFHIGLALAFVIWTPSIPCPDRTSDDRGVCQVLNLYVAMASWVPPALLIVYGICLSVYTWRYASIPRQDTSLDDEEALKHHRGSLPIMPPEPPLSASWPNTFRGPQREQPNDTASSSHHPSFHLPSSHRPSLATTVSSQPMKDAPDDKASRKSRHTSGRLSKRLPGYFF